MRGLRAGVALSILLGGQGQAADLSFDISLRQGSIVVVDSDVLVSSGSRLSLPGLPAGTDLTAFHRRDNGVVLFAIDRTSTLGILTFSPGDVIGFDGTDYGFVWEASREGLPNGVMTDAITEMAGNLVLSFDVTVALSGGIAEDEDLVEVAPGGLSLLLDQSARGIDPALDLDGASFSDADDSGLFLVSFDGSGRIDGINFDDEDILEYDLAKDAWRKRLDVSLSLSSANGADADALFEPGAVLDDTVFADDFEGP